jgi:hypothetical protein
VDKLDNTDRQFSDDPTGAQMSSKKLKCTLNKPETDRISVPQTTVDGLTRISSDLKRPKNVPQRSSY